MKAILVLAMVLLSSVTYSQTSVMQAQSTENTLAKTQGFTAGIIYSNLTSQDLTYSGSSNDNNDRRSFSNRVTGETHVGLYGLSVGYKNNYAFFNSVGFSTAASVLKGLNGTEIPSRLTIFKVQGDLVVPVNNLFSILIGPNVSYIEGENYSNFKYEPALGGQGGLQFNVDSTALTLGYQALGMRSSTEMSGTDFTYQDSMNGTLSGFIAQVDYTF